MSKSTEYMPLQDPTYLTEEKLWDTDWLKEKYPERFINNKNNKNGR